MKPTRLLLSTFQDNLFLSPLFQSEAISHAAYSIPWYQYPCSLRNPTNLLMIRSQRPVRLTAGKFVALSLETFASVSPHFLFPHYFPYFPYFVSSSFVSDDIHRCLVFHHDTKRKLTSIQPRNNHYSLSLFVRSLSNHRNDVVISNGHE